MFSIKLTVCLCLLFIIAIEAAPKPDICLFGGPLCPEMYRSPFTNPHGLPPRYRTYEPPIFPPLGVFPYGNQGEDNVQRLGWEPDCSQPRPACCGNGYGPRCRLRICNCP